jgi:hypothetical protein
LSHKQRFPETERLQAQPKYYNNSNKLKGDHFEGTMVKWKMLPNAFKSHCLPYLAGNPLLIASSEEVVEYCTVLGTVLVEGRWLTAVGGAWSFGFTTQEYRTGLLPIEISR